MALPAQAIEKLVQAPERTPGSYSQLIMLSVSVFLLAALLWVGMTFGYQPYLETKTKEYQSQINRFGEEIPREKQLELATFYSQIVNLETVLSNHTATTNFWTWLERNTSPNVFLTKLTINAPSNQIIVQGGAKGSDDIVRQISAYEASPDVSRVVFGGMTNSTQGWQWNATIFVKDSLLKPSYSPEP